MRDYYDEALYLAQDEEKELRDQITRHFNFEGLCPYCGTPFDADWSGWIAQFPADGDQLTSESIFVVEWGGWFIRCTDCNEDGERWPPGQIKLTPENVGECESCPHARECESGGPLCGGS